MPTPKLRLLFDDEPPLTGIPGLSPALTATAMMVECAVYGLLAGLRERFNVFAITAGTMRALSRVCTELVIEAHPSQLQRAIVATHLKRLYDLFMDAIDRALKTAPAQSRSGRN